MVPCSIVDFRTPKGFDLIGLWYGPKKAKKVFIFVHGLGVSVFGRVEREVAPLVADRQTAVLVFNNRGHDTISNLYRDEPKSKRGYSRIDAGTAHEIFTDCADDIQGAIDFARKQGMKNIYLGGHSTGCQKSIYWAYKKKSRAVKGIVLLAPMSDWAGEILLQGAEKISRAAKVARALVASKQKHELLPASLWHETLDAQRFLSLYTPDSVEEIFSYARSKKQPRILRAVKTPQLVLLGEEDEYADRPAKDIAAWFEKTLKNKHKIVVVPGVKHSFRGAERQVARHIRDFMK